MIGPNGDGKFAVATNEGRSRKKKIAGNFNKISSWHITNRIA